MRIPKSILCPELWHRALCIDYLCLSPVVRSIFYPISIPGLLDLLTDMLDSLTLNFTSGCSRMGENGGENHSGVEWCLLGEGGTVKDLHQVSPTSYTLLTSIHIIHLACSYQFEPHLRSCCNPH